MNTKLQKYLNLTIMVVCILLGSSIAVWTTGIQGEFLHELGVSKWGAMTVEPLLIIVSFLLGIKITKTHRAISLSFLIILFGISLITMVSMYTKKSYSALENQKISSSLSNRNSQTEEAIRKSLEGLNDRGTTSSKSIVKVIDQLQKQSDKIDKQTQSETLELQAIIETVSKLTGLAEKEAILLFAFFVSLAAVFSPSFLFFSAGMMLKNLGVAKVAVDDKMQDLSLKQKVVLLAKNQVTDNTEELAKFLGTSERVVKSQLSRIDKKMKGTEKGKVKNGVLQQRKRKVHSPEGRLRGGDEKSPR